MSNDGSASEGPLLDPPQLPALSTPVDPSPLAPDHGPPRQPDPLAAARELLARVGRSAVRQRLARALVLWDLGYLREALSQFRVTAEEALGRLIQALAPEGKLREELQRAFQQGQTTRVVERLHRGEDLIPARVALHLLTLLAWGNYASHAQRQGHHAAATDLGVLLSVAVELEEWLASEAESSGSIFDPDDRAVRQRELQEQSAQHGLDPAVARAFVEQAGAGASAAPFRLQAAELGLELFWQRPPARASDEPYRGLRAFEPEDASCFHGRQRLLARLVANVDTRRVTLVSGASGVGKTSLLRAGLVPALLDLGCGVLLVSDYSGAGLAAVRAVLQAWPGRPLAVIFDQLERVLQAGSAKLRAEILELLASASEGREGLRLVLSVREDFLGRLLREGGRLPAIEAMLGLDALVVVGPLDAEATRQAISLPLAGTGVSLAAELLQGELVEDLLQTVGTAPCNLQIVCGRLFGEARARGLSCIDGALYRELGGAGQILGGYLDETLSSGQYHEERELAWSLLRAMIDGETRRFVDLGELWQRCSSTIPIEDAVRLRAVLDRLIGDRLVVSRSGGLQITYSLVHDELARSLAARTSAEELERQQAGARLDQALASTGVSEPLQGRTLRLIERHWSRLNRTGQADARELLRRSLRARRLGRLGLALVIGVALIGVSFGLLQLRRATEERARAASFADQGVLLLAQLDLDRDPTQAVAWLRHLSTAGSGIGVMTLIEEARRRGVAHLLQSPGPVTTIACSPDGELLASSGEDRAVRLWDLRRHRPRGAPLLGHAAPVTALTFAGPGQLISAALDGGVRSWELAGGTGRWLLPPSGSAVHALAVAPGRQLAVAGAGGRLQIISLEQPQASPPAVVGHGKAIRALAFSPDGRWLASGSLDHQVRLWEPTPQGPVSQGEPLALTQEVYALAFSPDGSILAASGREPAIQLFRLADRSRVELRAGGGRLLALAFAPDGRTLAAAGTEKSIQLWDLGSQALLGPPLRGHLGLISQLAFSPDGKRLVSSSFDHTVRIWDVARRRSGGLRLSGHDGEVHALAFTPDGRMLYSTGQDGSIRRWNPRSGEPAGPAWQPGVAMLSLAASPGRGWLASGGSDGHLLLWDAGGARRTLSRSPRPISALAFAADGSLAAASGEGKVQLFDRGAARRRELESGAGGVFALVFTPDGRTLVTAGQDRSLHLWETATGRRLRSLPARHQEPVYALAVAPDGRTLASAGGDGTIQLWALPEGRAIVAPLLGHRHWVLALAFSPDGSQLASGSSDGTVRLWSVAAARSLGPPLLGHTDWVHAVAFSPDGRTLASASADRTIWLWQLPEGHPRWQPLLDQLTNLHVLPDGRVEVR